jgi:hypothetical protein
MTSAGWYEITQGDVLLQGDLLMQCPIFSIVGDIPFPIPDAFEPVLDAKLFDVITMTQSCDLENDKIEDILFAQVITWSDAVRAHAETNPALRSKRISPRTNRWNCAQPVSFAQTNRLSDVPLVDRRFSQAIYTPEVFC